MAKTLAKIQIGPDRKENDLHGTPDYPCEVYYTDLSKYTAGLMPEHWHNELEFGFVVKGSLLLKWNGQDTLVSENQCFFLNANVAHSMKLMGEEACFYSVVFHEKFICVPKQLYIKYVQPIVNGTYYPMVLLKEVEAVSLMKNAILCFENKEPGYEFSFYNNICALWNYLSQNHPPIDGMEQIMTQRIQDMLHYISKEYGKNIGVDEIAASTGISKRECYRCFKSQLNSSPNIYLMQFRMNRAAEMILLTDYNMDKIAKECGFTSATYFSTKFKGVYGMTPREYRERNR